MNKKNNTVLGIMVMFSMVLSIMAAPTNTAVAQTTNSSTQSGELVTGSGGSFTTCNISAIRTIITSGDEVNLIWSTTGFDDITINGEAVSGNSGIFKIGSLLESTNFKLVATNDNGGSCTAQVFITCIPPEVPKECELEIEKSVNKTSAVPGEELTYTIKVTNIGDADCTGGGVRIEDKIDTNLTYVDSTHSSNFSSGYGSKSVYEAVEHTLYFNGNTMTPGETGSIIWTGEVKAPIACGDFEVTNQARVTAYELNNFKDWVYSNRVVTDIKNECIDTPFTCEGNVIFTVADSSIVRGDSTDLTWRTLEADTVSISIINATDLSGTRTISPAMDTTYVLTATQGHKTIDCPLTVTVTAPEDKKATVVAHKIVCTDESQLPNYGNGGPDIISTTAADWVASNNTCSLVSGWDFEWTNDQSNDPGDTFIGVAGAPWNTFGVTDSAGETSTIINLDTLTSDRVWFREVLQSGYIPFTHGLNSGTNVDDVSAEFYCNTDVINYDNRDMISGMQDGKTYHCVAWNVKEKTVVPIPSCDLFTANPPTITVGASTTLTWETTNAVQVFMNNGIVIGDVDGSINVSPLADITYTLTVIGAEDKVDSCSVDVKVSPDPVPFCESFTATPSVLPVGGGTVVLNWNVVRATSVSIAPTIGSVMLDGSQTVNVTESTTYTLTAEDDNGDTVSCIAPVAVADPGTPLTCADNVAFSAADKTLIQGESTDLVWSTVDVDTVSISIINATTLSGNQSVSPTENTTYVLTATQGSKSVDCPVTVEVSVPELLFTCADNVVFTASDTSISRGQNIVLNWSTTDVDTVSISTINATTLSGSQTVSPSDDITYTLTATQGDDSIDCPVSVNVSSGGGGGGSSSPRCELDISDTRIQRGEEITLTWDTSRATEVTLIDSFGEIIFSTDDFISSEKEDYFDGSMTLTPTRNTEYILIAERGSRDVECDVEVEVEDNVVVLQSRDQQPLVAGISLSQVPYTGFEAGPVLTVMFYMLLAAWALYIAYVMVIRKQGVLVTQNVQSSQSRENMKKSEAIRPDLFVASVTAPSKKVSVIAPANLPTGAPVVGYHNHTDTANANPHQVDDVLVVQLEDRAHKQNTLLSSDAVRHFIGITSGNVQRDEALDKIIVEAKKTYPVEDGWTIINDARMRELCAACNVTTTKSASQAFIPATVPTGTGSLAEAIVIGNVVAAYELLGNRPMFALADASADLDALYRSRKGEDAQVSELLVAETKDLSDDKIIGMIKALTGAIDGTYTDEASAVKMAIMKAIKEAA